MVAICRNASDVKSQYDVLFPITLHWTQMADGILKFMIGHLCLGSNVQLGFVDFKVLRSANRDWF